MGMLAFLPWVTVKEPMTIQRYAIVPWARGTASPDVDGVLESYVDAIGSRVGSATLIHFAGEPVTRDLTEDERAELFDFGMVLAFSALTRRELCGRWGGLQYANTDMFRLVIQAFREGEPRAVATVARRRGGRALSGYAPGMYQVRKPPHVNLLKHHEVDSVLVGSLLNAFGSPRDRDRYGESIYAFNNANTDSDQVPVQQEIVALVGAFERLTEASGQAYRLAPAVVQLLQPHLSTDRPRHLARLNAFERVNGAMRNGQRIISGSITEAWVRDVYRMRNAFGHGRRIHDQRSAWTPEGHLLLGAHVFPLAVLVRLANDGHYVLTESDKSRVFAFSRLASLRQPLRWRLRRGPLWNYALSASNDERRFARALAAMGAPPKP